RFVAFAVILTLTGATLAQDLSGGAAVLLASAEVEAKLGKGIFTPVQNKPHATKPLEKKTVARPVRSAHSTRPNTTTIASNRQSSRPARPANTETRPATTETRPKPTDELSGPPLGGAARHTLTAENYNQQGDALFDAGQYDKAAESYQKAVDL